MRGLRCNKADTPRAPSTSEGTQRTNVINFTIHTDTMERAIPSIPPGRFTKIQTFVDEATRWLWIGLFRDKSAATLCKECKADKLCCHGCISTVHVLRNFVQMMQDITRIPLFKRQPALMMKVARFVIEPDKVHKQRSSATGKQ